VKIALVHDWLTNFGGSERCVQAFSELYPTSPLYTSLWDKKNVPQFANQEIVTSFLQKMPGSIHHHAFYLNQMPMAFERFDFSDYDVVLSSSHACAKGIITLPKTIHICYCHTPTRYLWDFWHQYINNPSYFGLFNPLIKLFAPLAATYLRLWDRSAAERVDYFIANSRYISERIKKYYRKPSVVIYPPVDVADFHQSDDLGDYFLLVSRLVTYKRVDLAISAFNELGIPLKIVGDGPEYKKLRSLANSNIEFLGSVEEQEKRDLMARCQAFIFPPEEDFGITAVEAMAAGRPVIALRRGGALETVVEGRTGLFFDEQRSDLLCEAVRSFDNKDFNSTAIRKHAMQFDRSVFKQRIHDFITQKYREKHTH